MATKKKGQDADTAAKEESAREGKEASRKNSAPKPARQEAEDPASEDNESKKSGSKEKKKEGSGGGLIQFVRETRQFLREVWIEFNKISWPARSQVIRETYSVLFLVTVITVMVLGFDWFVGKFIFGPLGDWARHLGGGVGTG